MTTPKFKIGDRVKWRDCEGRELSGAVMVAVDERGQITVREHVDGRFVARWHESHLSLDVPEDASWRIKACELQALLSVGMPIFCGKVEALVKASDGQKKEIERLTRLNSDHLDDSLELSRRLTEEIGGRHRERIAKEAALMGETLALDSLREIAKTLGDQSCLTAQGLREKTPALAKYEMKRLNAAQKELAEALQYIVEIHSLSRPRKP